MSELCGRLVVQPVKFACALSSPLVKESILRSYFLGFFSFKIVFLESLIKKIPSCKRRGLYKSLRCVSR